MSSCLSTIYIDEAGDLGVNRGTRWFVLTAVIVNQEDESLIRSKIKAIRTRLNLQTIHFRNVKDFGRRSYIVRELSNECFSYVNIVFDTSLCDKVKMPTERVAYSLICGDLLQRVSLILKGTNRKGNIVLSSRGTSKDNELVEDIRERLTSDSDSLASDVFINAECKQASAWDMLQLADVCATSMFYSHEVNGYGFITPCFVMRLSHKLCNNSGVDGFDGLIYYSDNMRPPKEPIES